MCPRDCFIQISRIIYTDYRSSIQRNRESQQQPHLKLHQPSMPPKSKRLPQKLAALDAFSKTDADATVTTRLGGLITLFAMLTAIYLLGCEWKQFTDHRSNPTLVVDRERAAALQVNIDIAFPHIPCDLLSLDVLDEAGNVQLDLLDSGFTRARLSKDGTPMGDAETLNPGSEAASTGNQALPQEEGYCGACYGAIEQTEENKVCCQTCEDVRKAYLQAGWAFYDGKDIEQCEREGFVAKINGHLNEGCRVVGTATLNRLEGEIHLAPGKALRLDRGHFHDTSLYEKTPDLNFEHKINHFSFGPLLDNSATAAHPLDNRIVELNRDTHFHQFSYYMKVVPTRYEFLNNTVVETAHFSATYHDRPLAGGTDEDHPTTLHYRSGLPGVFFYFETSPLKVINKEKRNIKFSTFLLNCITTIGGVVAVASTIDRLTYKAQRTIWGKKVYKIQA